MTIPRTSLTPRDEGWRTGYRDRLANRHQSRYGDFGKEAKTDFALGYRYGWDTADEDRKHGRKLPRWLREFGDSEPPDQEVAG